MNEETRAYSGIADNDMMEESQVYLDIFATRDEADFVAFDTSQFGGTFKADWQTAIDEARATPSDELVVDQQQQLTAEVETQMRISRNTFQSFKYWIEKAFPDKRYIWDEFGYDNYKVDSNDQGKMVDFMYMLHATASKYSAELIAVGLTQAEIDALQTTYNDLDAANRAQNQFINERKGKTQERINKYNLVWSYIALVCRVGKIIYKDNPAKYAHYTLPAGGTNEQPEVFSVTGKVTDTNGGALAGAVIDMVGSQTYQVQTDLLGNYGQAAMADGAYVMTVSLSGKATQTRNINVVAGTTLQENFILVDV